MVYRYDPCNPCCTDGGSGGGNPTNCSGCSWPSAWTVEVKGIRNTSSCQTPVLQPGATTPARWPDSPCFHVMNDESNALLPGCEILNGTFTLTSAALADYPTGCVSEALGWSTGSPASQLCMGAAGPRIDMVCCSSVLVSQIQFSERWTLPTVAGFFLLLWQPTGIAEWGTDVIGHPDFWICRQAAWPIPFFCPFTEIECFQPITFNQIPYVLPAPGLPAALPLLCQNFPGTLEAVPA